MLSLRRTGLCAAAGALAVTAGLLAPTATAAPAPTSTDGCLTSVPDPGTTEPVQICWTLHKPGGASAQAPVPVLLEGHGWSGSRTTDAAAFAPFLSAGYGVLSFDQRGFGESGGKAHVMDPAVEGTDVRKLVDLVAAQPWVRKDAPGDPRIGAIGGSYGGGYQYVGAFAEVAATGRTRFDALAPEYTWWDVNEALAPMGVPRSAWLSALWALGHPSQANTDVVNESFVRGVATGVYPSELQSFFRDNGPRWHVAAGRRLDVPTLVRQGVSDNLFNLNHALKNLTALTPRARARSVVVGFHGGHALPAVAPRGSQAGAPVALGGAGTDPCSAALQGGKGDWTSLQLRFFDVHLKGAAGTVPGEGRFALVDPSGDCLRVDRLGSAKVYPLDDVTTTVAAGAPQYLELGAGPLLVAGTPYVEARVSTLTPGATAFFALATGTSPADAQVVHSNTLPHREPVAVDGARRRIELPAVGVRLAEGEKLFLVVSPVADMYAVHGSRVPGAMTLAGAEVRVPVVR